MNPAARENDLIVELLQVAAMYDSRNIDRAMVAAWLDAARRQRWDPAAAADAVKAHYAESTERIMPGHVTRRLRAARPSGPRPARELLAGRGSGSSPEARAKAIAAVRDSVTAKRAERGLPPVESVPPVGPPVPVEPRPVPRLGPREAEASVRSFLAGRRRGPVGPSAAFAPPGSVSVSGAGR
ncbi:hypothetical protein ACWEQ4_01495 [Rhodococcus sp. NPDC003994]